ncbi:MAG: hypothetical protein Q8P67_27595 [archaeon]|nr:hypothetical protein [archaeon]
MNRDVAAGHSELRPWEPEQSDLRFVSPSATLERTQLGPGCVVGSESALSGVTLKRSLVGKGCSFSANKGLIIDGSVIMDGVVIQCRSKVEIHGSIICSGAQILPGCNEIRNSVIGYHQVVSHSVRDTLFTQNPSENN